MENEKSVVALEPNMDIENEDSDGWDEMEISGEQTTCLFCTSQFLTIAVAMDHCRVEHNFDLLYLKSKYNMDCYSYIKMINYIRKCKPTADSLLQSQTALWSSDDYLKSGDMESWLMYDFDDLGSTPSTPHYAIDGKTPISNITYSDLQRQIQDLTIQLRQKDSMLQNAKDDIDTMKTVTRNIVEAGDSEIVLPSSVGDVPVSLDSEYFNSYSHYGIHHEMLSDTVRTESYRDAILKNVNSFKDKTVLDVGCGTSILSMFAAKAEAKKVIGIDMSEVLFKAMDIIRENKLDDKITLLHGRLENVELPENKVDIIISEWMGYFLLFEGMLDTVIYARDNHLKPGGLILPNRCNINLVACSDLERYNGLINFWDDVYGFNMSCMKSDIISEANIETVPMDNVVSEPSVLTEIDLQTCNTNTPNFSANFKLKITKTSTITSLAGYFDTFFELENPVSFSTGPHCKSTHWKQTVFYLKTPIEVKEGEILEGTLVSFRNVKNVRGLTITIEINGNKYKYSLD
ncbi:PREDICTED: protein arginine N-methyltransferase 1 [Nicrophorus vespilloides]|uniref:type I protein arginine methyltransferase n=1 Tax=Nicrophorus vespilloides TaxID=110193 RepID=A0ABM1MXF2_NICVS|nr:PREDICTED: protein arginine N-methyltransferase 1 [Nicrophorus vespilloides]